MERKHKLPARVAARGDRDAKKRKRSAMPAAPPPPPVPAEPEEPPPPALLKSVWDGKPLPTAEVAQPKCLPVSSKDYQTVGESSVPTDSYLRPPPTWITDGLLDKYRTEPNKRGGVPEILSKVGVVRITMEPDTIDAAMYVVKGPKLKPQPLVQQQQERPIIQYGPPGGFMPPQVPQSSTETTKRTTATIANPVNGHPISASVPPQSPAQSQQQPPTPDRASQEQSTAPAMALKPGTAPLPNTTTSPSPSFRPRSQSVNPALAPPSAPPIAHAPSNTPSGAVPTTPALATTSVMNPPPATPAGPGAVPAMSPLPQPPAGSHTTSTAGPAKPETPERGPAVPATKPSANDPVITWLAQNASGDAELRDLIKRVAVGQAKEGELAHFQKIIDQLHAQLRSKEGQQGPSADQLLVGGRTVKYFAVEVRAILDIVLASNPNQKSSELRPPRGSDPLIILLVKAALEDQRTRHMIRRTAEGRPGLTDATDLKEILERLHLDIRTAPRASPAPAQKHQQISNSLSNGKARLATSQVVAEPDHRALRSKGPPKTPQPDVTAVVLDFGSGDRYLFPRFSILEYRPTTSGQHVVASFLIVHKGSTVEYGGDPRFDYYEPITIHLSTQSGYYLENLARVIAPQDEVRRYMDNVMDNMPRAEYVPLAMRLSRAIEDGEKDNASTIKLHT